MGALPEKAYSLSVHHHSLLQEVVEGCSVENSFIRSYGRSFNGFAAKLTDRERQKLASMKHVISVFPSRTLQLHTTRSWDFMGFNETIKRDSAAESDVIVGFMDSGIWPESNSFKDEGFGPAPKKWKGVCKGGTNFTCNNKIIGARYYTKEPNQSARDDRGHGSHTASIVAGNRVKDVSFYGLANGVARGGVPSSRIAVYKVCFPNVGCDDVSILAAFDDAIADGVDIISISIGHDGGYPLDSDSIAIGAFHAMVKGILTSQSAGNNGPELGMVTSTAPWILSVAAGSTDRKIIDKVVLGNGGTLVGRSVNTFTSNGTKFPLIFGKDTTSRCSAYSAGICNVRCLNGSLVKGKIVLCDQPMGYIATKQVGASGAIVWNGDYPDQSFVVPLPASALSPDDYRIVKSYLNTTKNPQAELLKSESAKDLSAPVVASFSSRGPNSIILDILKPDLSAPGIDILAAYSPLASPSGSRPDERSVKYSILSGTSMACPHATAVAAYVKSVHPDWSPSAVKSALMTTAWPMNSTNTPEQEFAYGSGHIDPVKAINPGLVYETSKDEYIRLLCSIGYNPRKITGDSSTCPTLSEKAKPKDLNYPSMTAKVTTGKPFSITFNRTVTNVGSANSTYEAKVMSNPNLRTEVMPKTVSFKSLNENKSFSVTLSGKPMKEGTILSSSLVWSDGTHNVRSPIVVHAVEL